MTTPAVFIGKLALSCPAGTVTVAGTEAPTILLDSATGVPPGAATPTNVTVPVETFPPTIAAGLSVTEATEVGVIVRGAVWLAPA